MGGLADRRMVKWKTLRRAAACMAVLLSAHRPIRLSAQVGHDPGSSPYHDIRRGAVLRLVGGYFSGSRGKLAVGPSDGPTGGLRLEYQASNVLVLTTGIAVRADRRVLHYRLRDDPAQGGTGQQQPGTGGRRAADCRSPEGRPFTASSPTSAARWASRSARPSPADTSGYIFGTKFTYGPEVGVRWYPARRVTVELGGRVVYYKLQYPLSYKLYVLPITAPLSEWTAHPWATFGVAWTF